jgi:hypothetical protein
MASLDVDPLVGMPLYVPAGTVTEVRKQRIHARLGLRLGKIIFGPAVLFVNRVVGLDGYAGKRLAALRDFEPNRKVIPCVGDQRQKQYGRNNPEKYAFQQF